MNLRVKEICKEKGITIQELADNMEMKRESLSRAINGNPTLETLEKIATALGVNITELFDQPKNNTSRNHVPALRKEYQYQNRDYNFL